MSKELGVVGTGGLVGIGREDFDDSSEWWVSGASSAEEDGWTVEQGTGGGAREDTEAEIGGVASEADSSGGLDVGTGNSRAWGSVSTVMGRDGRTAGTDGVAGVGLASSGDGSLGLESCDRRSCLAFLRFFLALVLMALEEGSSEGVNT